MPKNFHDIMQHGYISVQIHVKLAARLGQRIVVRPLHSTLESVFPKGPQFFKGAGRHHTQDYPMIEQLKGRLG